MGFSPGNDVKELSLPRWLVSASAGGSGSGRPLLWPLKSQRALGTVQPLVPTQLTECLPHSPTWLGLWPSQGLARNLGGNTDGAS